MKDYFEDKNVIVYFHQEPAVDGNMDEQELKKEFAAFMRRVKYALKKCCGSLDDLTTSLPEWKGKTLLDLLKENGAAGYNLGGGGAGIALDFEFGSRVYACVWWPKES